MKECLRLAKKGNGFVSPNPMVGCVIVYNNEIIGSGYHESYGKSHAEVNAINSVANKKLLEKSILYVNLEPCSHFGKTPPCCDLIIENKIKRVIVGGVDPFKKVSGKGIKKLKSHGINVKLGVLEKNCKVLNKRFFTFYQKRRPYIILKWAKSTDSFIAPKNQKDSFWMTCPKAKKLVHTWRSQESSILIGRITAEKDNPLLTVRKIEGKNPKRIIIDKNLILSRRLNIFNNDSETIVLNSIKSRSIENIRFVQLDFDNLIDDLLDFLYGENIQSILVEGGTTTIESFINSGKWDEARVFTANKKLIDGRRSPKLKKVAESKREIGSDLLELVYND